MKQRVVEKERRELDLAALKIQSIQRQKQAKREVDSLRETRRLLRLKSVARLDQALPAAAPSLAESAESAGPPPPACGRRGVMPLSCLSFAAAMTKRRWPGSSM